MKSKYSSLTKCQTYIIVPRNVDPGNFLSVEETKMRKEMCLWRSIFKALLISMILVGALIGIGSVLYGYLAKASKASKVRSETEERMATVLIHEGYAYEKLNSSAYLRTPVRVSPCTNSPCVGGGTCEPHDGTFTCYCPPWREGDLCERQLSIAKFTSESSISLESPKGSRSSIKMDLKPSASDGLILFSPVEKGNISLSLVGGKLQLRFNNLLLEAPYQLVLNKWHSVALHTYHGDVMMTVENEAPIRGNVIKGKHIWGRGKIILGGGYEGCIKKLTFDHNTVSFFDDKESLVINQNGIRKCEEEKSKS